MEKLSPSPYLDMSLGLRHVLVAIFACYLLGEGKKQEHDDVMRDESRQTIHSTLVECNSHENWKALPHVQYLGNL